MARRSLKQSRKVSTWPETEDLTGSFTNTSTPGIRSSSLGAKSQLRSSSDGAALYLGKLTEGQQVALTSMINPHVSAGSQQAAQVIPMLAAMIPGAFEPTFA